MSSRKIIDLRARKARFFYRQPQPQDTRVPLRERKRRTRLIAAILTSIFLGTSIYGLHAASYMERFTINEIEVRSAGTIDPDIIRQYVDHLLRDGSRFYLSRNNIFLYPRKVIEKDIVLDFPRVKSVSVSRPSLFSATLIVTVHERTFFALWCRQGNECYQMDADGFIFAEAVADNPATYVFSGGVAAASSSSIGKEFIPTRLPELALLLSRLNTAGFVPEGAQVENDQDLSIPLKDRFTLKSSFGADPETLIKNLQLILSNPPLRGNDSKIEYIDLRFGNRVYYKMSAQGGSASGGKGETGVSYATQ